MVGAGVPNPYRSVVGVYCSLIGWRDLAFRLEDKLHKRLLK